MITLTLKTLKTGLDSKTMNSNNLYVMPFKYKNFQGFKKTYISHAVKISFIFICTAMYLIFVSPKDTLNIYLF